MPLLWGGNAHRHQRSVISTLTRSLADARVPPAPLRARRRDSGQTTMLRFLRGYTLIIPITQLIAWRSSLAGDESRRRAAMAMKRYTLHMKEELERQLERCRSSIRQSITKKLQEIVMLAESRAPSGPEPSRGEPPLRFYVFEGYRISYEINPRTRRVVVLELRTESS